VPEFIVTHHGKDYRVVAREDTSLARVYDKQTGKLVTSIQPFHEPEATIEHMRESVRWYLDQLSAA
jgi:hypothetical protein